MFTDKTLKGPGPSFYAEIRLQTQNGKMLYFSYEFLLPSSDIHYDIRYAAQFGVIYDNGSTFYVTCLKMIFTMAARELFH